MLENVKFLTSELVQRYYYLPRRQRAYSEKQASFLHKTPEGLRFMLKPNEEVDRYIAVEGIYERRFVRYLRTIMPPDAVMIDIGANIGNHALYLHDICSRVECFEPNPEVADRLKKNIDLNHAHNVHVHRVGLGNRNDEIPFFINIAGNVGNSGFFMTPEARPEAFREVMLPIRKADEAIDELDLERLDFIKIDIEGLEAEIFRGLSPTIAKYRPLISFEYHGRAQPKSDFETIARCLPNYRIGEPTYAPESLGKHRKALYLLRHGSRVFLNEVREPESRSYENLLAIPQEDPLAKGLD